MNDTVAVLEDNWGGVVATGFNLALSYNGKIYNSESGGFNGIPQTIISHIVNRKSTNPGLQPAEKTNIRNVYRRFHTNCGRSIG